MTRPSACLTWILWIFSVCLRVVGQSIDGAPTYSLGFSASIGQVSLCGPLNTCYALQTSTDLTNWTTSAVLNPTVWPAQATLTLTQQSVFFRSAVLGTWSIGGFTEALDLRKDFGAVGDGVADDTGAIQAMFDSTLVHSNAVVFVPPGTYRLAQTCQFGTSTEVVQPRLVLVGLDASKTTFLWTGAPAGSMFEFTGGSPEIGGISLQTTNSQTTGIVYSAPQ